MSVEERKNDLFQKHDHITNECQKMNKLISLASHKSKCMIEKVLNIEDSEIFKYFTKIYKFLSALHLEVIDINCQLEIFFQTIQKDEMFIMNNIDKDQSVDKYDLVQSYLEKLESPSEASDKSFSIANVSSDIDKTDNTHSKLSKSTSLEKTSFCSTSSVENQNVQAKISKNKFKKKNKKKSHAISQISTTESERESGRIDVKNRNVSKILPVPDPIDQTLCCLGYVESPSNFFLQPVCADSVHLDYLSDELKLCVAHKSYFMHKKHAVTAYDPYCVCYSEVTTLWYRAQVVDWLRNDDDVVMVQLIDHGFTVEAPLKNLRQIPEHLCVLPRVALKCHLAFVAPINESSIWSQDAIQFFKDQLKPLEHKLYTISFVERQGDSLAVDLKSEDIPSIIGLMLNSNKVKLNFPENLGESSRKEGKQIHDQFSTSSFSSDIFSDRDNFFKSMKKGKPFENEETYDNIKEDNQNAMLNEENPNTLMKEENSQRRSDEKYSNDNLPDEDFNKYMKEQIKLSQRLDEVEEDDFEEYENPNLAVANYDPQDEKRICRFIRNQGFCYKGDSCRFSHEPLNPNGWTTDKEFVYTQAFNSLELPRAGVTAQIKVTWIKDLRTIFVNIKGFPDMHSAIYQPVNSIKSLIQMMNCEDEKASLRTPAVIPAPSQLILVQFCNTWQRASVLDIIEHCNDIKLEVFLVDYGNTLTVNMKEVREIKDKYLHYPFQAVRCMLSNTKLKEDLTEEQVQNGLDYLEMCTLDKVLEAKIMYSSLHLGVILFDESGEDIGQQLLIAGLLDPCSEIRTPFNTNILVD